MRRLRASLAAPASLFVLSIGVPLGLGACGSDKSTAAQITEKDFDPENFSSSTTIDNKWDPRVPGTQFVYEGRSNRGLGRLPHRVVFTVTDLTKVIDGVRTVVLWDRDINAGKLLEGELAFHAQDDDGNIWNLGEYPEEYDEKGNFEAAPDTWLSGLEGAKAGILMRADPREGTSRYRQGVAPKIEFGDVARVYKTGQRSCVPYGGCHEDVLVTDETNPLEPADGHQLKYYVKDVGNIRAAPRGGREKEILVLTDVRRLSPAALAYVRKEALKLDRRAYSSQKKLYGKTPPAKRTLRAVAGTDQDFEAGQ